MTASQNTAETYRRRSLHQLAIAITNGNGWNRERADAYHHALRDHDPRDVDTACQHLLTTWDRSVLPPPATILNEANQARDTRAKQAVRARETAAEHDRGIRRTEFDLDAPLCPRCNSGLMWLTDDDITYCPSCNSAQVQDPQTGRTKLTQADREGLRVAAGPPGRHMRHPGESRHLAAVPDPTLGDARQIGVHGVSGLLTTRGEPAQTRAVVLDPPEAE